MAVVRVLAAYCVADRTRKTKTGMMFRAEIMAHDRPRLTDYLTCSKGRLDYNTVVISLQGLENVITISQLSNRHNLSGYMLC